MSSFVTILGWCILFISLSEQTKQSLITVDTPTNGINMLHNIESVTTNDNEWKVIFSAQQSYDLLLQLNNEWGFDASNPSNITFSLNGTNYNSNEGDLLLVFSVSDSQYFGVVIRNEISSQLYKVYPQPFDSLSELLNMESFIIAPSSPDRWDRITNNTHWYNTIPVYRNPASLSLEWPIKFTIANDPIRNEIRYSQIDFTSNNELYSTTYLTSFHPNNGLDMYIMSDGIGESFGIYDINIEYQIQATTIPVIETAIPTYNPTLEPTLIPSILPTTIPSTAPIITITSLLPTTQIPTTTTTQIPTTNPTITPTTYIPTQSPTKAPITFEPTMFPTIEPTIEPTVIYNTQIMTTQHKNDKITSNYDIMDHIETTTAQSNENVFVNIEYGSDDIILITVVTAVLGGVYCLFTLALVFCCLQSQRYERTMIKKSTSSNSNSPHNDSINTDNIINYHLPSMQKYVTSNTNPLHYKPSQTLQIHRNNVDSTITSTHDIESGSDTCYASQTPSETECESKVEEKEGELVTTDIVSIIDESAPTSDCNEYNECNTQQVKYEHKPYIVNDNNNNVIGYGNRIDYNKMNSYLNDDDMSTSSEERILQKIQYVTQSDACNV